MKKELLDILSLEMSNLDDDINKAPKRELLIKEDVFKKKGKRDSVIDKDFFNNKKNMKKAFLLKELLDSPYLDKN